MEKNDKDEMLDVKEALYVVSIISCIIACIGFGLLNIGVSVAVCEKISLFSVFLWLSVFFRFLSIYFRCYRNEKCKKKK